MYTIIQENMKEVKTRCIYIAVVFCAIFGGVWSQIESIIQYLIKLTDLTIITASAFEMIQVELNLCIYLSVVIAFPFIAYQVYKFISPGLYQKERKLILMCAAPFYIMFVLGSTLPTLFFVGVMLSTLTQYYTGGISQTVTLANYMSLILSMSIVIGVLFCIPVFSGILGYIGVLKYDVMKRYRKHFFVISLVFTAMATPGPDALSMLLLELPVIFIYETSIFIVKTVQKMKRL